MSNHSFASWSRFCRGVNSFRTKTRLAFSTSPNPPTLLGIIPIICGGTGVIASWLHTREPRKKETTSVKRRRKKATTPKEPEAKQGDYLVGTDENVLVLNRTYANRSNAERAAKMQWERLQRGVASFSLQLAEGRADLYTEMLVKVTGFKQPIDDAEWTITTLTHSVSPDNGFTTSMELEVKIDGLEIE